MRSRQNDEEKLQQPSKTPLLLLLIQDSRKEKRRMRRRRDREKELVTELKPKPGFLYYTKYVGGSGQTITLSQVLCKGNFQIMGVCAQEPFL